VDAPEELLEEIVHSSYAQREIDLVVTTDSSVRKRDVAAAITRKGKLYSRYLTWAEGPLTADYPSGVLGIAGERVLAASVRAPALNGFAAVQPAGEVRQLLGLNLQGGSYDDAAYLTVETEGHLQAILVPFEMKNIRRWIYSDEVELHKFLYRSAWLQQQRPSQLICPVIVCRRRQSTALKMGQDLGFYAIATNLQFVLPIARIDARKFEEVRSGLGFEDLVLQDTASDRLTKIINTSLRRDALATAERWRERGATFLEHYDKLRRDVSHDEREELMSELREDADGGPGDSLGGW
jgi:hypothetical protein